MSEKDPKSLSLNVNFGSLVTLPLLVGWLLGISLAPPIIWKVTAAVFPPYAWYLVVDRAAELTHLK